MAKNYIAIYSALAANLLIAVTKFIAGAFTNSASMITEGVHSVVDTLNEVLLLYGLSRSKKPADISRPFGYGKELYFWSFIVSVLIFALGGGVSIYTGIQHIIHPEPLGSPFWNYIVLGLSLIFEGTSLVISIKAFNKVRGSTPWWQEVVKSKDPSSFLVLFEDAADVCGLLIVGICLFIATRYHLPKLDGIASVLVGSLLVFASAILARESRSLLMGEGLSPETQQKIKALAEKDSAVEKVLTIVSTYQSPEEIILLLIIDFRANLDIKELTQAIDRLRAAIKQEYALARFVIIQPDGRHEETQPLHQS